MSRRGAPHVVVVGAGIVGAAVAEALALDGARVTVVDRAAAAAAGDTVAGMGHVVAMCESRPQGVLTALSRRLWDEWLATSPATVHVNRCGTIWIAADRGEFEELEWRRECYASFDVFTELLSARELYDAEPSLRTGFSGGLRVPGDMVLPAAPAVQQMLATVRRVGGTVHLNEAVVRMSGREVTFDDGRTLACDYAVNAAGVAAAALTPGLPIRPRKGHLTIAEPCPVDRVKHQLVELGYTRSTEIGNGETSVAFNVQSRAGQLWVGSSRQLDDASRGVDAAVVAQMLGRAAEYIPAIAALRPVKSWAGLRAATPDGLPIIGPHPDDPRLLIAAGHEGLGLTTSTGTARLIADVVADRESPIPREPYLPERLARESAIECRR